VIGLICIF